MNELTLPTDHSDIHTRLHLQGTMYATTSTNVQAMIMLNYTIQYKMDTKAAAKTRGIGFTTGFGSNHTYHQR